MLEQKITIGSLELSNRLVMAPTDTAQGKDGRVTDAHRAYYDARTKGGNVGLVILEHHFIRKDGRANAKQLSIAEDADMEGLSSLAQLLHKNGSRAVLQISHAGAAAPREVVEEGISPSGIPNPNARLSPDKLAVTHPMSLDEIEEIREAFVRVALRVKEAGFDGVELHAAHGYLLNQFYSPLTNKREDVYTGHTIEGRIRLHREVIRAVRAAVGDAFVLGMRFGGCDYMEGGSTIEDAGKAAPLLISEGLDFIDVTGGMCFYVRKDHKEPGYFGDLAKVVKAASTVPVILAGGIRTREDAEAVLASGVCDLAGVGRAVFKDPDWARKAMGTQAY